MPPVSYPDVFFGIPVLLYSFIFYALERQRWAPSMVARNVKKDFYNLSIKIDLKCNSKLNVRSFYKNSTKKIWAQYLGAHVDSTV